MMALRRWPLEGLVLHSMRENVTFSTHHPTQAGPLVGELLMTAPMPGISQSSPKMAPGTILPEVEYAEINKSSYCSQRKCAPM